ncbi:unnamed protein product [Closterium sp. Yama58-4]|nr:unnamed protein product [Closterium sp. Yama58-4]
MHLYTRMPLHLATIVPILSISTRESVQSSGSYVPSLLTSYEDPMTLFQLASSTPNGSIFLTSTPSTAPWGAAFTPQPITLFLSTNKKQPCDQPIAFSVSFTFRMTPGAATSGNSIAGEGLAFVVTALAPQGAAAGVGLGGLGKRSVAVEFDSVLSVKHSDPNDNHVGVNVGGSPVSLASATAPLILNDAHTKHAWIHYDPTSASTLRVFLSASRQQPSKAVLTARVSLCSALKPTLGNASFLFGFVAAALNKSQRHDILSWKITTCKAFGQVALAEEVAAGSEGGSVPSTFHYASHAFQAESPVTRLYWNLPPFVSWMRNEATWPVKNQHGCGMAQMAWMGVIDGIWNCSIADSSAYAVVAAVEAAYSIASIGSQPPRLSVDQLRLALSSNCDDMPPRDVLAFLVAATRKGEGLVDDTAAAAAAAAASPHSMVSAGRRERLAAVSRSEWGCAYCFVDSPASLPVLPVFQKIKYYGIQSFEETSFDRWLGLLLAVQRQPVVVRIEASAQSFFEYDGLFSSVCGAWCVRGVCMAASADPCGSKSVKLAGSWAVPGSKAFNPCGQFKCSKAGASNCCACAAPHFVQAAHPDGSNTCAYVDACGLAGSNPCVVGTCVNDGKGSYSCVCPPGFVQGTTIKGSLSCAPGDSKGSYTVLGSNVWCSQVLPVFGLTLDQLLQQNKKLSCTKPLPVGSKLVVKTTQSLPNCSLFYTVQLGESCVTIAQQFNLSDRCPGDGDQACVDALVGLNPRLNCSELMRGQVVCVERDESRAGEVAVCDKEYLVQVCGSCDAVMAAVDPPLSPLEFYRLNLGINCNCLLTNLPYTYSRRKVRTLH